MKRATSLLIRSLLPLALLAPTAVANATPGSDDQKFADDLNEEGMLFNFNLQRRIAQDYCDSKIRAYNGGYDVDRSRKVTEVAEDYGLPREYASETLSSSYWYCRCTSSFLSNKWMLENGYSSDPPEALSWFLCSAYEIDRANKFGYNLPATR